MADGPSIGTAYLRVSGDFSSVQSQAVALFNSSRWSKLGKVAGAGLAAGLVAGGALKALYEVGKAFDDVSDNITRKTGATGKDLKRLEGSFKSVVSSVPSDFQTAGDAVAGLAQRLDLPRKPLTQLAKQITQLSIVTGSDIQENVSSITRLFGDWSVQTSKQRTTLDRLFRLTQSTGIEFSELSRLMVQFGSPLRQLGFRFDEAAVMFARFEREGVNMQTLLPGLRFALKNLALPTDDLAKKFKQLGVDTSDPHDALLQIFDLLSEDKISEADQTFLASGVFGGRAWADMKAAIEEGRFEFDDLIDTMRKGDETIAGAERRTRDFSEQWTLFKNNLAVAVEPVATRVFNTLGRAMKDITDIIRDRDLSWGEKWDRLVDLAMDALSELVSRAGQLAPKIAEAFVKGFLNAPILGQLAIGAWLFSRLGSGGAASNVGSRIAGRFGGGFRGGLIAAAPAIIGAFLHELEEAGGDPLDKLGNRIGGVREALEGLSGADISDIPAKRLNELTRAFQKLDEETSQATLHIAPALDKLEQRYGSLVNAGAHMSKAQREAFKDLALEARQQGDITARQLSRIDDAMDNSRRKWERNVKRVADATGESASDVKRTVSDMGFKVSKTYDNMAQGTIDGLEILTSNTTSAMKALGLKQELKWKAERGSKSLGQAGLAQKHGGVTGTVVPGTSAGDRHVLALNGQPIAKVESGELISVANRTATAHLMDVNKKIQRKAQGGVIEQALGPYTIPPIVYDPNHAGGNSHLHLDFFQNSQAVAFGKKMQEMGWSIGEYSGPSVPGFGPVTVQHQSPGHYDGTAFDANTAADETRAEVAAVARLLTSGKAGGAVGAVAEKIARVLLQGPDGPLKDIGQAALDKVRGAANEFLASKAPKGNTTSMDGLVGGSAAKNRELGRRMLLMQPGRYKKDAQTMTWGPWGESEWPPYDRLIQSESGWSTTATNPSSGAYGIPQSLPASKMAAAGSDWRSNAATQIAWGLDYIKDVYGAPSNTPLGGYKRGGIIPMLRDGGILAGVLTGQGPHGQQWTFGEAGGGGGKTIDIDKAINQIWQAKGAGDRRGIISDLAKQIKSLSVPGLTGDGELDGMLADLRGDATEFLEFADRASSLTSETADGVSIPGMVGGQDEGSWVGQALQALFNLRNRLIETEELIAARRDAITRLIDLAHKRLGQIREAIRDAERKRRGLVDDLGEASDSRGDSEEKIKDRIEEEMRKPKRKRDETLLAHLRDRLASGDTERDAIRAALSAVTEKIGIQTVIRDALKSPWLEDLETKRTAMNTGRGTILDELYSVQGSATMEKRDVLPDLGVLGGEIFDAQLRLRDLNAPQEDITDEGTTEPPERDVMSISELVEFARAVRLGAFDSNLFPSFGGGGIVPGPIGQPQTIEAHGREGVFTPEQMRAMGGGGEGPFELVITNWEEGKGYIRRLSKHEIRRADRDDELAAQAGVR